MEEEARKRKQRRQWKAFLRGGELVGGGRGGDAQGVPGAARHGGLHRGRRSSEKDVIGAVCAARHARAPQGYKHRLFADELPEQRLFTYELREQLLVTIEVPKQQLFAIDLHKQRVDLSRLTIINPARLDAHRFAVALHGEMCANWSRF